MKPFRFIMMFCALSIASYVSATPTNVDQTNQSVECTVQATDVFTEVFVIENFAFEAMDVTVEPQSFCTIEVADATYAFSYAPSKEEGIVVRSYNFLNEVLVYNYNHTVEGLGTDTGTRHLDIPIIQIGANTIPTYTWTDNRVRYLSPLAKEFNCVMTS